MASMAEGARSTLDSRTLLVIWAVAWSAILVIMVGDVWMQFAMQGRSFFGEWHHAPRVISGALTGAVLSIGVFAAFRRYIDPARPLAIRILRYLPIGVAFWLAWSFVAAVLDVLVWPSALNSLATALRFSISGWAFNAPLVFAVMAVLYELMLNTIRVSREETRAARYEANVSRAKTAALAAQLDPHFLFNTLHVASGLMRRDVGAARRVLGDLRELLDESFRRGSRRMVGLEDELRLVQRYLGIQQARFGDRLEVRFEVDPATTGAQVPPLLVQPLVENAIQHGIARQRTGGLIRIGARRTTDGIAITVENSASGETTVDPSGTIERIGLGGVRARLGSVFGDGACLEVRDEPGTFTAAVTLPAIYGDAEASRRCGPSPDQPNDDGGHRAEASVGTTDWDGHPAVRSRPWGWRRWVGVGALAWLWVIVHYHVVLGFRRLSAGLPFYSSWMQLVPNTLLFFVGALLTPALVILLRTGRRRIRRMPFVVGLYVLIGTVFWVVWTAISYLVIPLVLGAGMPLGQLLVMAAFVSLSLYTAIALIIEATWQLQIARDRAMEAASLRAELLAAETAALRSKVSPRLLLDSLTLASDLMGEDVRAARNVLSDLSELLRAFLGRNGDPFVPLEEELGHLRKVLDIHVGRGQGRAPVELELVEGAGDRMVPRLVLQPLAGELARRAAGCCGEPGRIVIRGEPVGTDRLRLRAGVECERHGTSAEPVRLSGADLEQVRQWLATAYGYDAGVIAHTSAEGSCSLEFVAPPGSAPTGPAALFA